MTLVLVVTFALILIGQFVLIKNKAKNPPPKPVHHRGDRQPRRVPRLRPLQRPRPSKRRKRPKSEAETPAASVERKAASGEVETVVENDLYRIVFTNKGAQAKSWVLKKYKNEQGQPLDLVNAAAVQYGLPLALYTYDDKLRDQLNSALYVAQRRHRRSPLPAS